MRSTLQNTVSATTRVRRGTLFVVLWAFGLSTTLLLLGMWGRAVTSDQATLTRSTEAALSADVVAERVFDWVEDGIAAATDLPISDIEPAIAAIEASPEADQAVAALVEDAVAVLMAPAGTDPSIDVMAALGPLVPRFVAELSQRDVDVSEGAVVVALAELDEVEVDTGVAAGLPSIATEAGSILTLGVVLAATVLLAAGLAAIALSEDRVAMVRSLGTRLALSGVSFAILFRFGGWALDPDGGRSPLMRSGAIVIGSNQQAFLMVAAIGALTAAVSGAAWWLMRRRNAPPPRPSTVEDDEPTRELVAV